MIRFRQVFANQQVILPVIHTESLEQVRRNATIARDAGSDGVFLINHGMTDEALLAIHDAVVDDHPGWWIGVNCLGLSPVQVFAAVSADVGGVWVDNAGIDEAREDQPYAERVAAIRQSRALDCIYFGGVAFKYQRRIDDLEAACRVAARYMDVITTSGPGTGHAADVEKIRRMKHALTGTPLAIASGITPENVADYLPWADAFLVATGISRSFTELDPMRVRALVERVRSFEGRGLDRALRLIDVSAHGVPAEFARIIVGLLPSWFDFAADKFDVHSSERGLTLIAFNAEGGKVTISTSDSRCMTCVYLAPSGEEERARMDMHYRPDPDHVERTRAVVQMALRGLFPSRGELSDELARSIPPGRVFPPGLYP